MSDFEAVLRSPAPVTAGISNARAEFVKLAETVASLSRTTLTAAARKTDPDPTEAQKESGRYRKGRVTWKGLPIVIETARGQVRRGKDWQITMKDHYGFVAGKESGADGDEVDVFLCEDYLDSEVVFVVNQLKRDGKTFDEHKCVLGCVSEEQARKVYLRNYSPGWTGLGSVKAMTLPDFKKWVDGKPEKAARDGRFGCTCPHCGSTDTCGAREMEKHPDGRWGCANVACGGCGNGFGYDTETGETSTLDTNPERDRSRRVKSAFENYSPSLTLVKRAADDAAPFTVAVDLDGTLAEKEQPFSVKTIGGPITKAIEWVRLFHKAGARIIIFTVRGTTDLVEAWLKEHAVPYDYVNENPDQPEGSSGKVIADVYWDDRALNAEDPDEHGPEILRRVSAGKERVGARDLLASMEEGNERSTGGGGGQAA